MTHIPYKLYDSSLTTCFRESLGLISEIDLDSGRFLVLSTAQKGQNQATELTNHHCLPEGGIEGLSDPDIKSEFARDHHGTSITKALCNHQVKSEFVTEPIFENIPMLHRGQILHAWNTSTHANRRTNCWQTTRDRIQTTLTVTYMASKTAKSSPNPRHRDGDIMSYFTNVVVYGK